MSKITSTLPPGLYTDSLPPVPTFTVTAFGSVPPANQLRLDASGLGSPFGKMVRKDAAVVLVTVAFSNTASTFATGTPPTLVTATSRVVPCPHGVLNGPTLNGGGLESRMRCGV